MVKFINKLLFNVSTQKDDATDRYISRVLSGAPVFIKDPESGETKERSRIDLLTVNSEEKKLDKGSSYTTFVEKVTQGGKKYNRTVAITNGKEISENIKGDHIYCIGIPFNGTLAEIELPKSGVNVYAGAILLSRTFSIPYENRKYSRIVYLVLTVDPALHADKDFNIDFVSHSQFCAKNESGLYAAVDGRINEDRIQVTFHNDSRKVKCYHEAVAGNYIDIKDASEGKKVFTVMSLEEGNRLADITRKMIQE